MPSPIDTERMNTLVSRPRHHQGIMNHYVDFCTALSEMSEVMGDELARTTDPDMPMLVLEVDEALAELAIVALLALADRRGGEEAVATVNNRLRRKTEHG